MNKEKYNLLLETYANHCLDRMDIGDMMDYVYQGMLVRFEEMHKGEMLDEIKDYAPHLLEEAA